MREIVRTNDAVLVSAIGALLDGARIHHLVLDQNMSVLEGSLGILPWRVLVAEDDVIRAHRLLTEAVRDTDVRPDGRGCRSKRRTTRSSAAACGCFSRSADTVSAM